jgi:hypothetical protein
MSLSLKVLRVAGALVVAGGAATAVASAASQSITLDADHPSASRTLRADVASTVAYDVSGRSCTDAQRLTVTVDGRAAGVLAPGRHVVKLKLSHAQRCRMTVRNLRLAPSATPTPSPTPTATATATPSATPTPTPTPTAVKPKAKVKRTASKPQRKLPIVKKKQEFNFEGTPSPAEPAPSTRVTASAASAGGGGSSAPAKSGGGGAATSKATGEFGFEGG